MKGPLVSSGDPVKDALVETIKSFQSSCQEVCHTWFTFCEKEGSTRDPARYPVDVLQQFVQDHCSPELLHRSRTAQALAPCHFLSGKVESLIDCAKRREDAAAIAIFEEIRSTCEKTDFPDALKCGKHKAVEVFNMLVQCAGRIGRTELIEDLLGDMTSAGIRRPLAFYQSTIKMVTTQKYWKLGMYVYSCIEADGVEPSPVILSCLIRIAGELGDSEHAISFFNQLKACSIASLHDYTAILSVHSRAVIGQNVLHCCGTCRTDIVLLTVVY